MSLVHELESRRPARGRRRPRRAVVAAVLGVLALAGTLAAAGPATASTAGSSRPTPSATSGEWPQLQGGVTHSGVASDTTLARAALIRLEPVWSTPVAPFGDGAVVVDRGVASVDDHGVTAVRVSDGATLWHTELPAGRFTTAGSPSVSGGVVVVAASMPKSQPARQGGVWGFSTTTGALLWSRYLPGGVVGAPTIHQGAVLVTTGGAMTELRLRDGGVVWTTAVAATSAVSVDGNLALASNLDGSLTVSAVDVTSGKVAWTRPLGTDGGCIGGQQGTGLVDDRHVVTAGACTGDLRSYGVWQGHQRWASTGVPWFVSAPMALSPTTLLLALSDPSGDAAIGVDRASGAVTWRTKASDGGIYQTSPILVGGTEVLAGSGLLDLRDPATGSLVGTVPVPSSGGLAFPVLAEGHLFVIAGSGSRTLVALAPA